jgi:translation initiation factor 2D
MFKKDFTVAERSDMSNKERKKFKKSLIVHFKQNSIQEYFLQVDKFYTEKVEKKKYIIICDDQNPLWVDSTGKGDFFPTVYSLSLYPKLAENYLEISSKILKKLRKKPMITWSEITNKDKLKSFGSDDVVGLLSEKGDLVGVGAMACSSEDDQDDDNPAVYVLQNVQDKMFEHGNMELQPIKLEEPEPKKEEEKEEEKPESESESDGDDDYFMGNFVKNVKKGNARGGFVNAPSKKQKKKMQKAQPKEEEDFQPKGKKGKKKRRKKNKGNDDFVAKKKEFDDDIDEIKETKEVQEEKIDHFADEGKGKRGKKGKKRKNKGKNKEGGKGGFGGNSNAKMMDKLIVEALLNCLILSVNDKDLPIETPKFWSEHIVPCKSADINIKESSFKKLGKFFKAMEKRGLLKIKEGGKRNTSSEVIAIVRHSKELSSWEPTINEVQKDEDGSDDESNKKGKNQLQVDCKVEEYCVPAKVFEKYMKLEEKESMSYKEFTKRMNTYIKDQKLNKNNKIEVSQELANNLGIPWEEEDNTKIVDKEIETLGLDVEDEDEQVQVGNKKKRTTKQINFIYLKKSEFFEHISKKLTFGYSVTNNKGEVIKEREGKFPGMTIYAEKQHGQMITRVVGLESFISDLKKFASELEKKLSTSFKVKDIAIEKDKTKEISTQGIFLDEIKDMMMLELKVDENLITVVNKIDKKKKKQTMMGY